MPFGENNNGRICRRSYNILGEVTFTQEIVCKELIIPTMFYEGTLLCLKWTTLCIKLECLLQNDQRKLTLSRYHPYNLFGRLLYVKIVSGIPVGIRWSPGREKGKPIWVVGGTSRCLPADSRMSGGYFADNQGCASPITYLPIGTTTGVPVGGTVIMVMVLPVWVASKKFKILEKINYIFQVEH